MKLLKVTLIALFLVFAQCSSDDSGSGNGNGPGGFGGGDDTGGVKQNPNGTFTVQGTWSGTGKLDVPGKSLNCQKNTYNLDQTDKELSVSASFECDDNTNFSWGPVTVQIDGADVLLQNQKVGSLSGNTLSVKTTEQGSESTIVMTQSGNQLTVVETETNQEGTFKMTSQLTRQ